MSFDCPCCGQTLVRCLSCDKVVEIADAYEHDDVLFCLTCYNERIELKRKGGEPIA